MFDPERFLVLAARLARHGSEEEDYRCAVSRTYYACFLTARDNLFGNDGARMQASESTHRAVIDAIPDVRISRRLNELRELRVQADYYTNPRHRRTRAVFKRHRVNTWAGLAEKSLALATEIWPALTELKPVR